MLGWGNVHNFGKLVVILCTTGLLAVAGARSSLAPISLAATNSIDLSIASNDSAIEQGTKITLNPSSHTLGYTSENGNYYNVFRFQEVPVPRGARITQAYFTKIATPWGYDSAMLTKVAAEAVDNALASNNTTRKPSDLWARRGNVAVDWDPGKTPWAGQSDSTVFHNYYDSVDFSSVIQELVDRPGWTSGNSLMLMVANDGGTTYRAIYGYGWYTRTGRHAPILHIEWEITPNTYTLATNVSPTGMGTISRNPNRTSFNSNETITLTATPASGWNFSGWRGDGIRIDNSATPVLNFSMPEQAVTVTADFTENLTIPTTPPPPEIVLPEPVTLPPDNGGLASFSAVTGSDRIYLSQCMVKDPGVFSSEFFAKTWDGLLRLVFPIGSRGQTSEGWGLSYITLTPVPQVEQNLPIPEGAATIGLTYKLGPGGATFSPPITLTMLYKDEQIPPKIREQDLVITRWDAENEKWVALEDCAVDGEQNTITASLSRFSIYTIMGYTPKPAPAIFSLNTPKIIPSKANPGQTIIISATVTNSGDSPGAYTATLKVNNSLVDNQKIILSAGASQDIVFSTLKEQPGKYIVDINGMSGEFTVEQPQLEITQGAIISPKVSGPSPTYIAPIRSPSSETVDSMINPETEEKTGTSISAIWIVTGLIILLGLSVFVVVSLRKKS
jgi:hypothetical protein